MPGSGRGYHSADSLERTFVFVEIADETFDWWQSYTVHGNLLGASSHFQLHAPALPRDDEGRGNQQVDLDARGLKPGQKVRVYVKTPKAPQPVLVITGYILTVDLTENRAGASVDVTGGDHLTPIINSDVLPSLGLENITYRELIRRLLTTTAPGQPAPYFSEKDILIDNDANRVLLTGKAAAGAKLSTNAPLDLEQYKLDQVKPHPGETVYAFLTRHAQRFGLLIWGTADGKIVFGRPNYDQKPLYDLRLRQGLRGVENNCDLRRHKSMKHRPSEVHVYGRSKGGDHMKSSIHAIAVDQEVKDAGMWGVLTIHDNNARTKAQAEQRAKFEMSQRRMGGDVLHARLEGHSAEDGTVYAFDTIASVAWDKAGLFDRRYIVSRTFTRERYAGTHTDLELVPKGAIALGSAS